MTAVHVVGAGLAGCEAALQLARRGVPVELWEMRPGTTTGAHGTDRPAELVCSNSLGSDAPATAPGVLKAELALLGSALLEAARRTAVPAGSALAVDRGAFADDVGGQIAAAEGIVLRRAEVASLEEVGPGPVIVATGPLTSGPLADDLRRRTGAEHLFFVDAIAPIVDAASLDMEPMFRADRRRPDAPGDYLNIPLDREGYEAFVDQLLAADRVAPHPFESERLFEGCQPIEAIAARGRDTLRFGPMRPVGLTDPRTGRWPHAVVQLRAENRHGTAWGLVGFQTRLRHGEQRRLLRSLPGMARARFLRLGSIHRNTYLDAPACLDGELRLRADPRARVAGQLAGCEGYVESIALGLMAALWTLAELRGLSVPPPPPETMLGGLLAHLRGPSDGPPSPMNVNFGLVPPVARPEGRRKPGKRERRAHMARRANDAMTRYADAVLPPLG